jgi:hypothetical protein
MVAWPTSDPDSTTTEVFVLEMTEAIVLEIIRDIFYMVIYIDLKWRHQNIFVQVITGHHSIRQPNHSASTCCDDVVMENKHQTTVCGRNDINNQQESRD